jgi:hypothetical protein
VDITGEIIKDDCQECYVMTDIERVTSNAALQGGFGLCRVP